MWRLVVINRCRCVGGPPSLTPSVLRYVTEEEQRPDRSMRDPRAASGAARGSTWCVAAAEWNRPRGTHALTDRDAAAAPLRSAPACSHAA